MVCVLLVFKPKYGRNGAATPVYDKVNQQYKTKQDRLKAIRDLQKAVERALKKGFSPYETEATKDKYSAEAALKFALSIKKETLKPSSYRDYENRLSHFTTYLKEKGLLLSSIEDTDRRVLNSFLNDVLKSSSARNRNNTRTVLSALFTVLEDNDIIVRNFIRNIKNLTTNPERNKTYSLERVEDIYKYLEKNDTLLLLFIKFVSYNFLRPIEVCRLQVKDLNLKERLLYVLAKNKPVKTKIIPDILISELANLDLSNPNHFVFTPNGVGEWETKEESKRDYFTKRFNKLKKYFTSQYKEKGEYFEIGKDYTVYSFRHTFITKLYRQFRKDFSKTETEDRLMLIIGHSTKKALQQYLREIDAEIPEDYSKYLK